jgi:hypothetical protein
VTRSRYRANGDDPRDRNRPYASGRYQDAYGRDERDERYNDSRQEPSRSVGRDRGGNGGGQKGGQGGGPGGGQGGGPGDGKGDGQGPFQFNVAKIAVLAGVLVAGGAAVTALSAYFKESLATVWRQALTERLHERYFSAMNYYQLSNLSVCLELCLFFPFRVFSFFFI